MAIEVVKVNPQQNNFTHYIGRRWAGLPDSAMRNPFRRGVGTRADAIEKFAAYWYAPEQKYLRKAALLTVPDGSILGCWCRTPEISDDVLYCHGDIIAGYLNWKRAEPTLF
jgi:hypothetical protein